MSQNRTFTLLGLTLAAILFVVAGAESLTYAVGDRICGCGEQTPCRCAADGICRPKRTTWGHYDTRWRSWPGEPPRRTTSGASQTPEEADDPQNLPEYELPTPEQEDLRVPPKSKKKKDDDESSEEELPVEMPGAAPFGLPAEEPAQLLPGPEAAPAEEDGFDLDPFGVLPEVPPMEDAPPALPASLRQAAAPKRMPRVAQSQRRPIPGVTQTVAQGLNITPEMLAQPVRQVSWNQPASMPVINPAAAIQTSAASEPLQQAIYIESTDQ